MSTSPRCLASLVTCLLFLTVQRAIPEGTLGPAKFPLRVSGNHRYLEDSEGRAFLVVGDTAWSLIAQLREEDLRRYLDDRARRGFNATIVNLIEHKFASRAPARLDGTQPFLERGDLTRPNPLYFEFAHHAVEEALQRGISVWLCPAYLGWGGGDEGFFKEIKAAGPAALRQYGHFVGEHFRDLPNIIWMIGGDFAVPLAERWTGNELANGLRDGGAKQLMTAHGGQTSALDTFGAEDWLGVDNVYSYTTNLYVPLLANYARKPARPFVLIESIYEGEHNSKPEQIRRQAWWAMLCGAAGQFFGNNPIWHFDGPTLFAFTNTWQQALDSDGSRDVARLGEFFRSIRWQEIVPDSGDKIVVDGRGSGPTQVIGAHSPKREFAVLYIPSDGNSARELTLSLDEFPEPMIARWFDPASYARSIHGESILIHPGPQKIRTPGANGSGTSDWVLVIKREHP